MLRMVVVGLSAWTTLSIPLAVIVGRVLAKSSRAYPAPPAPPTVDHLGYVVPTITLMDATEYMVEHIN